MIVRIAQRQMVRQGDVLLVPVDRVPDAELGEMTQEGSKGRIVLAHGEVTGHAHAVYFDRDIAEKIVEVPKNPPRVYSLRNPSKYSSLPCELLRLDTRALVRHEEHDPISLAPGDWLKIIQHEGDEVEELRRVAD